MPAELSALLVSAIQSRREAIEGKESTRHKRILLPVA